MKIIRNFQKPRPDALNQGSVVTLGKFDGVHLGHQHILTELTQTAAQLKVPSIVMLFEPHPHEFFQPEKAEARLMRLREKYYYLAKAGINYICIAAFNQTFSQLSAVNFIEEIILDYFQAKHLIVGDDCRFGAHRQGNIALLNDYALAKKFNLSLLPPYLINNKRVSSSWLRQALKSGDLKLARQLTGRPYCFHGRIATGDQRGRTIGFPTANINLHRHQPPMLGVYAVQMHGIRENSLPGVANIGYRPTVNGKEAKLEVFLFDFNEMIYGRHVQVDILHKIRDEKRFESLDDLKQQIQIDVAIAKKILKRFK